jgi:hypothetical protein
VPKPSKYRPLRPLYQAIFRRDRRHPKDAVLSYAGRSDGIGAQVHAVFSLAAYAHLRGLRFSLSPLRQVDHNTRNLPDWDLRWNRFFGFPPEEPEITRPPQKCRAERLFRIRDGGHYRINKAHAVVDLFPASYDAVMPYFRERYDQSPVDKQTLFETDDLKIAVHLRRGDAKTHQGRASGMEAVAARLRRYLKQDRVRSRQPEVLILSQGECTEFKPLVELGARLALDADVFATYHSMVTADVLFTAKSSFSYSAALLNRHEIHYEPFWHPPLPRWPSRSGDHEGIGADQVPLAANHNDRSRR